MWLTNLILAIVVTVLSAFGGGAGSSAPHSTAGANRKGHVAAKERWERESCGTISGEITYGPCGEEVPRLPPSRNR
jgi:hypothetical protein